MTETQTEALQDKADKLAEKLEEEYPESWRPEPGEKMVGIFKRLEKGTTSYGESFIVILENPDTGVETSVWLFHTVLRNQFKQAAPDPGELVGVKYEGKVKTKDGKNEYANWTVRVERDDRPADWSQVPSDGVIPEQPSPFDDFASEEDDKIPF